MKKWILFLFLIVILSGSKDKPRNIDKFNFNIGETYTYLCHMGFLNAGKAEVAMDTQIHQVNGQNCFKVKIKGWTVNPVGYFYDVHDEWISYMDKEDLRPHKFVRKVKENKYRMQEETLFNYDTGQAFVKQYFPDCNEGKGCRYDKKFKLKKNVWDMITAYYYTRTIDFESMNKGELFFLNMAYEDSIYNLQLNYLGKKTIKTKFGKIEAYTVSPLIPKNSIFSGDYPIKAWISADDNRVPIVCKVKLIVGSITIEIIDYKNPKKPFHFD